MNDSSTDKAEFFVQQTFHEVADIMKDFFEETMSDCGFDNQANASVGPPKQNFPELRVDDHNPTESSPVFEAIPFMATLTEPARDQMLMPSEHVQNSMTQPEEDSGKRLADYHQQPRNAEKFEWPMNRVGVGFSPIWSQQAAISQEADAATYAWQRTTSQVENHVFPKNIGDLATVGPDQLVQERPGDYADDPQWKYEERPLQNEIPGSPAVEDIFAEEIGREVANDFPNQRWNTPLVQPPAEPLSANTTQATSDDLLNQQLDEQTKIARALDEISRQGLQFVTGVGLEGL